MSEPLDKAHARAGAYRLLSECYHPPDASLLQKLTQRVKAPGRDPFARLPAVGHADVDELQKDYAALFVGPFGIAAPPYGSVYMESGGRVCGDSTADAEARYRAEGLAVTIKEPADHIAIEMEYMYLLVSREIAAVQAGLHDIAADYRAKQHDFLGLHLGVWAPAIAQRIVENAQTIFYRCIAQATQNFVREELEYCSARVSSNDWEEERVERGCGSKYASAIG